MMMPLDSTPTSRFCGLSLPGRNIPIRPGLVPTQLAPPDTRVGRSCVMPRAVQFDHYGGVEVLNVAEVEVPSPASGEVVVEVKAAGINPGEASIREGYMASRFPSTFPSGEGSDLAGVV